MLLDTNAIDHYTQVITSNNNPICWPEADFISLLPKRKHTPKDPRNARKDMPYAHSSFVICCYWLLKWNLGYLFPWIFHGVKWKIPQIVMSACPKPILRKLNSCALPKRCKNTPQSTTNKLEAPPSRTQHIKNRYTTPPSGLSSTPTLIRSSSTVSSASSTPPH